MRLWSEPQRGFASELLDSLGWSGKVPAEALDRFFARTEAEADRRHRDRWADRLAPREALLEDLLGAVGSRLRALDELRLRAQRMAVIRGAGREVLHDGFNATEVIYGLVDPAAHDCVRYVGRTDNPLARYKAHWTRPEGPFLSKWIEQLTLEQRMLIMVLIERCSPLNVEEREVHWIQHYRERGQADLNRKHAGLGTTNMLHTVKKASGGGRS